MKIYTYTAVYKKVDISENYIYKYIYLLFILLFRTNSVSFFEQAHMAVKGP